MKNLILDVIAGAIGFVAFVGMLLMVLVILSPEVHATDWLVSPEQQQLNEIQSQLNQIEANQYRQARQQQAPIARPSIKPMPKITQPYSSRIQYRDGVQCANHGNHAIKHCRNHDEFEDYQDCVTQLNEK